MPYLTVKHRVLKINSLPKEDRVCSICYYEFGQRSRDGVREEPCSLLPCKHIFGSHCIGKWFIRSRRCPYCRAPLRKSSSVMLSTERPLTRASGEAPKAYVDRQAPETESEIPISRVLRRPFKQPRLISQLSRLQHPRNEVRSYGRPSMQSPSIDRHGGSTIVTYSARKTIERKP